LSPVLLSSPPARPFVACSLGMLALSGIRRAAAEESPCTAPRVQVDLDANPEWLAEVPGLRARLQALDHIDACAEVTIVAEPGGASVTVTSGGRTATRHLTVPGELARTVEALVVVPAPETEPAAALDHDEQPRPPRAAASGAAPSMEIGVGPEGRVGGHPLMLAGGLSAFAELVSHRWLLGVNARFEFADVFISAAPPSGFTMDSGGIGVAVGRRLELGSLHGDALLGPMLVLESEEAFGSGAGNEGIGGSVLDARVSFTFRLSGAVSDRLHLYAAGDVELSPKRLASPKQLDPELPPLPAWTSGLAVGLAWGFE